LHVFCSNLFDKFVGTNNLTFGVQDINKLIKGCLRNDRLAQKEFYHYFADNMYALCLRYTGNEDEAKDVLQDAFIKVFKNLKQYKSKGSFHGWVRRIVVNTALERFRDKNYLFALHADDVDEVNVEGYSHVLEEISKKEIMNLVQSLTPQYRVVFNLYAIEGYSHKEIAEMLNIKEGTSKSNLSRAREILKEKLTALFEEKRKTTKTV